MKQLKTLEQCVNVFNFVWVSLGHGIYETPLAPFWELNLKVRKPCWIRGFSDMNQPIYQGTSLCQAWYEQKINCINIFMIFIDTFLGDQCQ